MKRFKGALLLFGSLFALALASRLSTALERPALARSGAGTPPSRFGKLTSRRWAYGEVFRRENLAPVPNPNPAPEPKPRRDRPFDVVLSRDGRKAYITLQGSELEPGSEVAVYDVEQDRVVKRILLKPAGEAGPAASSPFRMALHPGGRHLVVSSRFSNFLSVIDTETDEVTAEVPLDFYAQGMVFDRSGRRAFVADRYLDQVFVVEVDARGGPDALFKASMRVLGGLDEKTFLGKPGKPGIHALLARRCGKCHSNGEGRFYAGPDRVRAFLSAVENAKPGEPGQSRLLRAASRTRDGGYADALPKVFRHKGGAVFADAKSDADHAALSRWIASASEGPGIPVGNERSKPKMLALDPEGRRLFVGNTGTQDISVVDARSLKEVGSIYIQNVVNDLAVYRSPATGRLSLLVATNGVGFDVARERDPYGGESWDRDNPAAQYTVWRDTGTGKPLPRSRQEVLGPLDAVDGTAGVKFRDLQNDLLVVDIDALGIPEEPAAGGGGPLAAVPGARSSSAREGGPRRLLLANRYEANKAWVRYTSDTAESTCGDLKGDIPPDLMRVAGALPEKFALSGDRVFVTMQGSNLVQELRIQPEAAEASDRLVPVAVYPTGWQPIGIAAGREGTPSAHKLFVANFMGGTLSVIDRRTGESRERVVDPSILRRPMPDSNAERGEMVAHTAVLSSDGDTSCIHCHYLDMGDGRPQGVSQVIGQEFLTDKDEEGELVGGGVMVAPQMRGLFGIQPFFLEGGISVFEPRSMLMEHAPADDFARPIPGGDYTRLEAHRDALMETDVQSRMSAGRESPASLEERRDAMFRERTMRFFGKAFTLRDIQRFIGEWQIHEPRLLPNPFDRDSASVRRGREIFEHPQVGCVSCHPPPHFAKKDFPDNRQQAFAPMTMFTMRDGSFTFISMNRLDTITGTRRDLEPWDIGRVEETQGHFTPFPLRGIWDRPPVFLHNGAARTLHEALATPGHRGLRWFRYEPLLGGFPERVGRREAGFNATYVASEPSPRFKAFMKSGSRLGVDTHGGTLHLSGAELDDLVNFLNTIE